jgi:hypothetical protein
MNKLIIGCTAHEALTRYWQLVGKSHVLRLFNGRVFYDEIAFSGRRICITRATEKNGDVLEINRYISHDAHVELVPYPAPTSAPARIREVRVAVEVASLPAPMPRQPFIVDVDPHEVAANQRRVEFRQRRLWQEYDSGKLEAIDFCPALPPAPEVPKAERKHVYDGRFYGSYSYYSRNR